MFHSLQCACHLFQYYIIFSLKGEMPSSFLISSFLICPLLHKYIFTNLFLPSYKGKVDTVP
jgi:hypothetical protein